MSDNDYTFLDPLAEYTDEQALEEAARCLNCKTPRCVEGCPASVPIPKFIALLKSGEPLAAEKAIREQNCFPSICSRVCQQEKQCEGNCVRGIKGQPISIGRLERFAVSKFMEQYRPLRADSKSSESTHEKSDTISPFADALPYNGHKIAIIGSGPSGMACAAILLKLGYKPTIFEASEHIGGVPVCGIPEFRLPFSSVLFEINLLKEAGAEFITGCALGRDFSIDQLFSRGFSALFIGCGVGACSPLGIPGEDASYVFSASEFLSDANASVKFNADRKINLCGKRVAVIGGGNVAIDAARCAKRLGAKQVDIIYRRSRDEIPACAREINEAAAEGIIFNYLTFQTEIIKNQNGEACGLKCIKMRLGEADSSGRARPVPIPGSEHTFDVDCIIYATGEHPEPHIFSPSDGISLDRRGYIKVSDCFETSRTGVFAGGDIVTGAATVVAAIVAGRTAAKSIDKYVKSLKSR